MLLNRRQLLGGLTRVGLGVGLVGLGGCGGVSPSSVVIRSLKQMAPGSVLNQFRRGQTVPVEFVLVEERRQLFQLLQEQVEPPQRSRWNPLNGLRRAPPAASLTLLGADWLSRAQDEDLIQPFSPTEVDPIWEELPQQWRRSARNFGSQIWSIPWRWGVTVIAYNQDKVPFPIQDWSDLWHPELRGKLTLPDHPREVIGLTLKRLGRLYESSLREEDPELQQALGELHTQVLSYTSRDYLPMLRTEDAWVTVGWSEDLFPLQVNFSNIRVVVPQSGTAIWWDGWVKPHREQQTDQSELISAWLQHIQDPELVPRIVDTSRIANVISVDSQQLSRRLQDRPEFDPQLWDRSEIWYPLTSDQARLYLQLWRQMRLGALRV